MRMKILLLVTKILGYTNTGGQGTGRGHKLTFEYKTKGADKL